MRTGHEPPERKVLVISRVTSKRYALAIQKQLYPSEDGFRNQRLKVSTRRHLPSASQRPMQSSRASPGQFCRRPLAPKRCLQILDAHLRVGISDRPCPVTQRVNAHIARRKWLGNQGRYPLRHQVVVHESDEPDALATWTIGPQPPEARPLQDQPLHPASESSEAYAVSSLP
jgi:hypothetical protein